ncbi:MAG: FAD-binding oxidoreductase [Acidiferrobacterales bacterium]|nr:FAD-binding oxidoreductase [Acidiferrobacterales bacterium]
MATCNQNTAIQQELASIVRAANVLTASESTAPYLKERRGRFDSETMCVVLPADVDEVSAIVRLCRERNRPIVPQGGNTGVCGGAVADAESVIINLQRMNRVRGVDETGYTMEVESGCILADLQSVAIEHDMFLPLSLGAEGSCQIGGNLSTNAGGVNVLRYGNARDLVLGLEVVLPDGSVWNGMNSLRKNNTGYDLKNIFIGAEGTLGIITAAVLKLFPRPTNRATVMIAIESVPDALELFSRTRKETSNFVSSFELMSTVCVESAFRQIPDCSDFFPGQVYPWYVLVELGDSTEDGVSQQLSERFLERALDDGVILDAVVAQSERQSMQMWRLREAIVECQNYEGKSIKNDVSVPLSNIAQFIDRATASVESMIPDVRCFAYGHIGDGNIHFNLSQPPNMDGNEFFDQWNAVCDAVHEIADSLGGSFSAEHGIGLLKLRDMTRYKSTVELNMMNSIKLALDPDNIMNPGKVLPS